MLVFLPDILFLLVAGSATYFVARRLMIEAALIFLAVLISSLLAITTFEPAAGWCSDHLFLRSDVPLVKFLWSFFAISIFALVLAVLLQSFFLVVAEPPVFERRVEAVGCWVFGGLAGYTLAAFLLTTVHIMPVPRDFWGILAPEASLRPGPVMALAPDYQFLSFVDYVCVPHSPVSGAPWALGGPFVSPELRKGRWASFPVRYALWREDLSQLLGNTEIDEFYEDEDVYDYSDDEMGLVDEMTGENYRDVEQPMDDEALDDEPDSCF